MGTYRNNEIIVRFDVKTCIHSGNCLRGLPTVFDIHKRPWVNVDAEDAEAIQQTIGNCPSGALTYEIPKP